MQVAELTAVLNAEVTRFEANMKAADAALEAAQKQIDETEASTVALAKSLDSLGVSNQKMLAAKNNLQIMQNALGDVRNTACGAATAINDVALSPAQAAETAAAARSEVNSLHDIRNAAIEAAAAEKSIGGPGIYAPDVSRSAMRRIQSHLESYDRYVTSISEGNRSLAQAMADARDINRDEGTGVFLPMAADAEVTKRSIDDLNDSLGDLGITVGRIRSYGPYFGQKAFVVPPTGGGGGGPQLQPTDYTGGADIVRYVPGGPDNLLLQTIRQYSGPLPGQGTGTYAEAERTADTLRAMGFMPVGRTLGEGELPPNPIYNFAGATDREIRERDSRALTYLKSKGVTFDPNALGGIGRFKTDVQTHDALLAAALGLESQGTIRRALRDLGWGSGGGIHIPGFGIVGGAGGRGGFGLFGRNIFGGMAGFGTPLGLAGFGAERALFSSLGILGSLGGGILGGGVLGLGALGTFAVGAGTNLAGVGQAIGDTKTVSSDLGKLNSAIQEYGKNSTQAADAQAQLNQDLRGFSPVARQAVLAAAQTSQQFKTMFDKFTGPAEKIGAEIINQAMQVGEKFLPTIGKFAHQNMLILQSGLQPFFSWLQKGGNQNQVIQDVNRLVAAQKQFGVHSTQAAEANQKLIQAQKGVGGLGIFTNLEQVFQKNFPTAIHAGEQGFELFMKTIDLAAQHLGHFMATLDNFFTRMNNQDFGVWASEIEKLIGLFHSWLSMFASFFRVIFDIFKPAVGLGKAFAELMTQIFNQIGKYLNQSGTQDILHQLFSVHLVQLIDQIGGLIKNLLPIIEGVVSAFIQIEAVAAKALGQVVGYIKDLVGWFNKIPGADKILGWAIAFRIIQKANAALFGGLTSLLRSIPFIGTLFGAGATEAETATGAITASVDTAAANIVGAIGRVGIAIQEMIAQALGIGPAFEKSALEADAALGTIGGAATRTAGVEAAATGGLLAGAKGFLLRGALYGSLGYFGGQMFGGMVGGKKGSHYGSLIGLGAGIGTAIDPGFGTAVGAGIGALAGFITSKGPSLAQTLVQMSQAAKRFGLEARAAARNGDALGAMQFRNEQNKQVDLMAKTLEQVKTAAKSASEKMSALNQESINTAIVQGESAQQVQHLRDQLSSLQNTTAIATQKLQSMAASVAASNPELSLVLSTVARLNQQLGHMPSQKKITILIHEVFSRSFKKGIDNIMGAVANTARGALGLPPLAARGGHHGPTVHLNLPPKIQDYFTMAADGHYSQKKANQAAYNYYQKQLQQPGLTHAQKMKLYQAQSQYYQALYGTAGGLPKTHAPGTTTVPTGYLAKQQQETARARIEINKGQFAAALKLLNLEKSQLEAMLKTTKNQAERTRILNQLATVTGMIKSAKHQQTGITAGSYQIPLYLQLAMAKADALAALNPNNQGPTNQQVKLALQAKNAAMKAIKSHTLSMQQLIDAWNVVGQMNQILAQRLQNKMNTYHVRSTDAVTDMVKGLTAAQEMQLRELMAQRDAHRGFAPNYIGDQQPGSQPASPHHKRHHRQQGPTSPTAPVGGLRHPGNGDIIINGNVYLQGVHSKDELWAEMKKRDRRAAQRAGARR